ncbi:MAG: nitroreductase family protein [Elusimicrobia bacterium]|nr:nitroreductase family protein [Elusimicrobiota bacterium]
MKIAIDHDKCTACGRCVEVCNINFSEGPDGKPTYEHFMALLRSRRSRREFTEQAVSREHIDALLAAAAQAPNGLNRRNVGYTVITDRKVLSELSLAVGRQTGKFADWLARPAFRALFKLLWGRAYADLEPLVPLLKPMAEETLKGNDMVLYKAPCAILLHTLKHDACGAEDAVYCGANILLAAETLGLGACVIGFLTGPINSGRGLRELARIPPGHKVHTSIIAGHPRFAYSQGLLRPLPETRRV